MTHNVFSIAKYIVDEYKIASTLKLQKLLYFIYLKYYQVYGKLMFEEKFEAWVKGPVLRKIYNYNRDFGMKFSHFYFTWENSDGQISIVKKDIPNLENKEIIEIIDITIKELSGLSIEQLIEKSHKDKHWKEARGSLEENEPSNNKIQIN